MGWGWRHDWAYYTGKHTAEHPSSSQDTRHTRSAIQLFLIRLFGEDVIVGGGGSGSDSAPALRPAEFVAARAMRKPERRNAVLSRAAVRGIALRDGRTNWHERAWRDAARSAAPRRLFVADDAPLLAVAHKAGQEAERAQIVR